MFNRISFVALLAAAMLTALGCGNSAPDAQPSAAAPTPQPAPTPHINSATTVAPVRQAEKVKPAAEIAAVKMIAPANDKPVAVASLPLKSNKPDDVKRPTNAARATLTGHKGEVSCVAFSPDGKRLVSIGAGHGGGEGPAEIKFWDVAAGKIVSETDGHRFPPTEAAYSPDGKLVATGGYDLVVKIWNADHSQPPRDIDPKLAMINSLAFSPDGKTLALGGGFMDKPGEAGLWNVATGERLFALDGHDNLISGLAFSANGKLLATGSFDGTVKLWDPATGKLLETLDDAGRVWSVAFSPDGKVLAAGSGKPGEPGAIKLWDVATRKPLATLTGHSDYVSSIAFSPDGKTLASASGDQTVKLWDWKAAQETATLRGHTAAVAHVAFSPDGKTLATAGGADGTVRLWDMTTALPQKAEK